MSYSTRRLALVLLSLQYTSAYIQNAICPQCAGYNGYTPIDSNPLSHFNGASDFGNQLGKAIAGRINEAYTIPTDTSNRMTFGSYPTSSFSSYGGQNYITQPDMYQQALSGMSGMSGYGTQGLGTSYPTGTSYPSGTSYPMSFSSFPGYNFGSGQTMLPSNGGYSFGNYNNLGGTTYGANSFGNYGSGYGIPDPIPSAVSGGGGGGSCPYCFGNKGGFKAKKSKRATTATKKN
ncbi:hypothetical protein GCK32_001365 [Trichostrongylus colubriformis]|uniref:Uncharacterized protein n=1 Tax=Trichostrongylus colubriformis TaxID=6319 RepID=A0AAN8FG20_TRICO